MITLDQDTIYARWDTLPDDLRAALVFEDTSDLVRQACVDDHLSEEKTDSVASAAALVLMGFLHPGDMADEIRELTGVNIRIANEISHIINQKLFVPLQKDLEAVYHPVAGGASGPTPLGSAPKMLEEISPVMPVGAPKVIPSSVGLPPAPQPAVPKKSFADPGWSKIPPISIPDPSRNLQKTDAGKIYGLDSMRPSMYPEPPPPLSAPKPPAGPAPVIMQSEAVSTPLNKAPQFKMASDDKIAGSTSSNRPIGASQKPAVIEFGGAPSPKASPRPAPSAPRVVNYAEPQAASSSAPARSVTEVTENFAPSPAKPSAIPSGIPIPKPPVAPSSSVPPPKPLV